MLELIDPDATVEYSCRADTENPTVFILRPLTAREKLRLLGKAGSAATFGLAAMEESLFLCLKGWRNAGQEWSEESQDHNLNALDDETFMELALKVLELSGVRPEAKKKSKSRSVSRRPGNGSSAAGRAAPRSNHALGT